MQRNFTLEYWKDEDWFVGRLKEVPGIFSQAETLQELEDNIQEVYQLMQEEKSIILDKEVLTKELELEV